MPDSDNKLPLSPNDSQSTELRMRRALGLQGPTRPAPQQRADQARPRHRFVQDGGVPVVVLNSRGDTDPTAPLKARIVELETALEAERGAHGSTKRMLQEAQASAQASQTRLAHAELAHGEALAVERRARKEAEDALQARSAPVEAPVPITSLVATSPIEPQPVAPPPVASERPARKAPRAARVPRAAKVHEPQPVKWWLPSFREKSR